MGEGVRATISEAMIMNANDKMPSAETLIQPKKPDPQTQKPVALHTLAFCLWHLDRIPIITHRYISCYLSRFIFT